MRNWHGNLSPFGRFHSSASVLAQYAVLGLKPEFVVDFVSERYFTSLSRSTFANTLTFSRASSATMVDSTGTLVTVGVDEPRIGHHIWDGSAWVDAGYLHESEARTNHILYSHPAPGDLVASYNLTVAAGVNIAGAPSISLTRTNTGTLNEGYADLALSGFTYTPGSPICYSARVRTDGTNGAALQDPNGLYVGIDASGTVSTGAYGQFAGATVVSGAENMGGDEWFIWAAADPIAGGGGGPSNLWLWGGEDHNDPIGAVTEYSQIQAELGLSPSSCIPTNGAAATRAAETLTAPSANLPWGSAVSIQMEGTMTYADEDQPQQVTPYYWFLNSSNYIFTRVLTISTLTGRFDFLQEESGVLDIVNASNTKSPGVNVPFNIASRHGSTFINGAVDGTALTENTTPVALPDLSSTDLEIGYDFMGCIRTFRVWANDLGDEGIAEATS